MANDFESAMEMIYAIGDVATESSREMVAIALEIRHIQVAIGICMHECKLALLGDFGEEQQRRIASKMKVGLSEEEIKEELGRINRLTNASKEAEEISRLAAVSSVSLSKRIKRAASQDKTNGADLDELCDDADMIADTENKMRSVQTKMLAMLSYAREMCRE